MWLAYLHRSLYYIQQLDHTILQIGFGSYYSNLSCFEFIDSMNSIKRTKKNLIQDYKNMLHILRKLHTTCNTVFFMKKRGVVRINGRLVGNAAQHRTFNLELSLRWAVTLYHMAACSTDLHPDGSTLSSDWSVNSFIMTVLVKIFYSYSGKFWLDLKYSYRKPL